VLALEPGVGLVVTTGGCPLLIREGQLEGKAPVAGQALLAGSTFLPQVLPAAKSDAVIVHALRKAGAVLAGRAHLHEFAYGITGENPHYGDCAHPRFPARTTGGSSSGSAALVAAGVVPLAIGTDTGGSVRVPAAFCGLFGFRLQPRDAFIADAFPLAPSYDTAGWFTANAGDMRAAIDALVGLQSLSRTPRGCYLELPGLDPDVADACSRAAARLAAPADAATREELLNVFAPALETYGTVVADEAWAVHQDWADRFQQDYDPAVWQRLIRGRTLTAAQRDAARQATDAIRAAWERYFEVYHFLLLPATPCPALTKPECNAANRTRLLSITAPVSIGGLPVLTIPVPLPSGLTTGLQVVVNDPRSPVVDWVLDQLSRG
jgi:amidase/aspartyl-tRNA(Asn)/glutamyl-tRNA(Gln) amidotransferase subunit A